MGKLTEEQVKEIQERYLHEDASIRSIAADYGVSRTTINRILNPEYAAAEREKCRKRWQTNQSAYSRKHYSFALNTVKDADIIKKLESEKNRNKFIKNLIRASINK